MGGVGRPRTGPIGGTMTGAEVILGLGAAGALGIAALIDRCFFEPRFRVPGRPGRVRGPAAGVPGLAPRSRPHAETDRDDRAETAPSPVRVREDKPGKVRVSPPRTVQMGVGDQVRSFVAWMLEDFGTVRLTDKRVVQNYLRWAEEWNVVPIPASILLANLK